MLLMAVNELGEGRRPDHFIPDAEAFSVEAAVISVR
jgi:hypothetical protein